MTLPTIVVRVRDLIEAACRNLDWFPPLAARLVLGVVFIQSGWGKLHDLDGTAENFAGWHIPLPHFNAVLASATEFGGGCLVLLGLGTRLVALPLTFVMMVAIATAKWPHLEDWTDFFGWDETAYAVMFLWLATAGAGAVSIDRLLGAKLGLTMRRGEAG